MAVENKYVNPNLVAASGRVNKLLKAPFGDTGSPVQAMVATLEIAAGDDDGSIYRLWKSVNKNIVPLAILVGTDGITNGTDYDLGVYKTDLGAVIDKDCLMDGLTMASAADLGFATALDGMDAVDIANYGKTLWELSGAYATEALAPAEMDIALTANTVGTAAGTITVVMFYVNP